MQAKIDALKEALKGDDIEAIKARKDELMKAFGDVATKVYQQSAPQGTPGDQTPPPEGGADGAGGYYDGDVH